MEFKRKLVMHSEWNATLHKGGFDHWAWEDRLPVVSS